MAHKIQNPPKDVSCILSSDNIQQYLRANYGDLFGLYKYAWLFEFQRNKIVQI